MLKPIRFEKIPIVQCSKAADNNRSLDLPYKFAVYDKAETKPANIITIPGGPAAENTFASLATVAPIVSEIGVYSFQNFELRGLAFIFKDGKLVDEPDLIPSYVRHDVDRGHQPHLNSALPVRTVEGRSIVAVSNAYQIYGHWLLDILPRIWLAEKFFDGSSRANLIIPHETPDFALTIIKDFFGIHSYIEHDLNRENLVLDQTFVPSLLHNDHYFHPAMNDFIEYLQKHPLTTQSSAPKGKNSDFIYITRKNYRSSSASYARSIINEEEVFDLMANLGFQIVSPEEMLWQDQINLFSNAKIIIGEDGSALHNAIFSGRKTAVVCLNPANQVQISIAALRSQFIITQCSPKEDSPVGSMYRVDIDRLREAAMTAISATGMIT